MSKKLNILLALTGQAPLARMMVLVTAFFAAATTASAESHASINTYRSSDDNIYVQEGLEGQFGTLREGVSAAPGAGSTKTDFPASSAGASGGAATPSTVTENWQGYGLKTGVGVELHKFFRLGISHTFVDIQSQATSLEHLTGSRLAAEGKFIFSSPLANLEVGGGVTGSRLDMQKQLDTASFYGTGYYESIGFEEFITYHLSFFGEAKASTEHLVKDSGGGSVNSLDADLKSLSLGFSLWI